MNKALAHTILTLFDIVSFVFLYLVARQHYEVLESIESQRATIEYESSIGFTLLLLIVPALHFYSIAFEKSTITRKFKNFGTTYLTVCAATLIVTKYLIDTKIESALSASEYSICATEIGRKYEKHVYCKTTSSDRVSSITY